MTTVTEIITDAYRKGNLVALGASPSDNQNTEALRYLNRIVKSVFGNEAGDKFTSLAIGSHNYSRPSGYPWYPTTPDDTDWFVPANTRVMFNLTETVNLYLTPHPDDGARFAAIDVSGNLSTYPVTIYGNGRSIESSPSIILNTNNTDTEWFYRADTGNWIKYASLLIDDTFPFPSEFDDYFIIELALRLNPSYGTTIDDQSTAVHNRSKVQLRARYRQTTEMQSELALLRMPKVAIDRDNFGQTVSPSEAQIQFNKGYFF
jgi:hypothetical protein